MTAAPECPGQPGRVVPSIDRNRCEGKEDCVRVCPYDVLEMGSLGPDDKASLSLVGRLKAWAHGSRQAFVTNGEACHACGLCVAACPEKAIRLAPAPSQNDGGSRMNTKATAFALLAVGALASTACFNGNSDRTITADNRFEVATASVVLGARQLLVDTSNGDVWMLQGDRAPGAEWVLLARGPEDLRDPEPIDVVETPAAPE